MYLELHDQRCIIDLTQVSYVIARKSRENDVRTFRSSESVIEIGLTQAAPNYPLYLGYDDESKFLADYSLLKACLFERKK